MKKAKSGRTYDPIDATLELLEASEELDYELVEELQQKYPDVRPPNKKRTWLQETAWLEMHDAHLAGDADHVKRLLKAHPWLEKSSPRHNSTWLPLAVRGNSVALVKFWLDKGYTAEVRQTLFDAKSSAMTKFLLENGADPKAYFGAWGTPLHEAREPEQIRLLLAAGANPSVTNDAGLTPLAKMKSLGRAACAQALIDAKAPAEGRLHPTEAKRRAALATSVTVDLRQEKAAFDAYVRKRVKQHLASKARSKPVKLITFGYEIGQGGWVVLSFDTRSDAEPDGDWTLDIDRFMLSRPKWPRWHKMTDDATLIVISPAGKRRTLNPGGYDGVIKLLGSAMKDVLLQARRDGVFEPLNKADGCKLIVEHFDGEYGWSGTVGRRKK